MAPTFIPGDQLYVRWYSRKGAKASALAVGNIVILERDEQPGVFYIKRLTEVRPESYQIFVSSDNPEGTDSRQWGWLPVLSVRAKVVSRVRVAKK